MLSMLIGVGLAGEALFRIVGVLPASGMVMTGLVGAVVLRGVLALGIFYSLADTVHEELSYE